MNIGDENYKKLREYALNLGLSLFGVADIGDMKEELLDLSPQTVRCLDKGISMAVRLSDAVIEDIVDRPTRLYLHHYRQANYFLDRTAFAVAQFIQGLGGRALPIGASQTIDWEKQRGHLSHREVAIRAGMGWLGRNNLLVTPKWGARVRLVTILTDLTLRLDQPLDEDCGDCRLCLSVCPCRAIAGSPDNFDQQKCFQQLREFKNKLNLGHYICGLCVKACFPGKKTADSTN